MVRVLFLMVLLIAAFSSGAQTGNRYLKPERYTFAETGVSLQAPQHFDTTYMLSLIHI